MSEPEKTPENRRGAVRRFKRTTVICQRGEDGLGPIVSGQILNISLTGAMILVKTDFAQDEAFFFVLVNARRQTIAEVRCVIRWRKLEAPGVHRLGVHFDRPLTAEELAQVV